ncbi:hypothetical protein HHI36_022963 [Cryptolaemus montrouzieri]|uniref:Uncharacterized protein n=1 Tax=Cryptolaemus montrouzieri TaxID=559131 RepID=A0ABD2PEW1_9CUCU
MERTIATEEGKRLAEEMKAIFLETSAKQNQAVSDVFHKLLLEIEKADGNMHDKTNCSVC